MQQRISNGKALSPLLPDESRIVWLCDVTGIPYVRESVIETPRRRGKPGCRFVHGVIVGYSEIAPSVERSENGFRGYFLRRVFWLAAHDRANEPDGVYATGAPMEATYLAEP